MTNLITPKQFLNAFETLWNEDASDDSKRKQAFRHKEPWNEYMLGSEPPGFLRRVADKLNKMSTVWNVMGNYIHWTSST